jgi:signal transduction histidine kinase
MRWPILSLLLIIPALSAAQAPSPPSTPSTIVYITSAIDLKTEGLLVDSFQSRWRERESLALILHVPLSPYTFPLTDKAAGLYVSGIAERLGGKPPTIILAQGDQALDFALRLRDERFPGRPIIAFDIVAREGRRSFYQGSESLYIVEVAQVGDQTLALGMRLFPKRKRAIVLLSVRGDLAQARATEEGYRKSFPGLDLVILPDPTQLSAEAALKASPESSFAVAFTPGWTDAAGRFLSGKAFIRTVEEDYGLPVLSHVRAYLDGGTVGGVGLSPAQWGRDAAERGLSLVFDGKEPERWAKGADLANAFADYRELERFGSSPELLPPGAELINAPPSAWIRYRRLFQLLLVSLLLAVAAFALWTVFKYREKKLLLAAKARLESEVASRTQELHISNEELETANRSLVEAMRQTEAMQDRVLRSAREITLGRFAAGMANNLNSPLNAARSASASLRSIIGEGDEGLASRLFSFDEGQRSLFLRYSSRVLSRSYPGDDSSPDCRSLELRLARLSAGGAASRASETAVDLSDSGLASLDDGELAAFADEGGRAVAQALYRLSTIDCSAWIIDEAVARVAETVKTLREYAIDGCVEAEDEAVDLRDTIERALSIFASRLSGAIELRESYESVPAIRGSEAAFVRVWASLIQNALQAMPRGGVLELSLRREGRFALVSVEDDGEGVDPSVEGRLFEPFVTTREEAEGMGLGLAFCKRAIEAAGGEMGYRRREKGSAFFARIPVGGPA